MSIMKIDKVLVLRIISFWVLIYCLIIIFVKDIDSISSLTEQLSIASFSILMGLIIGSVGILIGTISELYSLLIATHEDYKLNEHRIAILDKLSDLISELKENTLTLIKIFVLNIIIIYTNKVTLKIELVSSFIPKYLYPYLSKQVILTTTSIFLVMFGMWIIYDIVSSMFTIHKSYMLVLKNNSNKK